MVDAKNERDREWFQITIIKTDFGFPKPRLTINPKIK